MEWQDFTKLIFLIVIHSRGVWLFAHVLVAVFRLAK